MYPWILHAKLWDDIPIRLPSHVMFTPIIPPILVKKWDSVFLVVTIIGSHLCLQTWGERLNLMSSVFSRALVSKFFDLFCLFLFHLTTSGGLLFNRLTILNFCLCSLFFFLVSHVFFCFSCIL